MSPTALSTSNSLSQSHDIQSKSNPEKSSRAHQPTSLKHRRKPSLQKSLEDFSHAPVKRCTEKLSNLDRLTKIMSDKSDMSVIKGVLILEDDMDESSIESMLQNRMVDKFVRFRSKLHKNSFVELAPHELDIRKHIHHIHLNPARNSENHVRETLSQFVNQPFNPTGPLWEAYIIHGYADGLVLMLRVHHSIGDGAALAMVFNEFCDQDISFPECMPPAMAWWQKVGYVIVFFFLQIINFFKVIWKSIYMIFGAPDPASPIKIPVDTMAREKKVSWTRPFDLADAKKLGRPYGATFNDVMLCVITGGLDRFRRKKCMEDNDSLCELEECDIRCIHPINTRNSPVIKNPDNDAAFLFALLPLGMHNASQRLLEIKERMDHLKAINEKFYAKFLITLLNYIPGKVLKFLMDSLTRKVTVTVSNVRGPSEELTINGNRVKDCIGLLPSMHGIGVSVCIFSYNGRVRLGLTTDSNLTDDPQNDLISLIEEEYDYLLENLPKDAYKPHMYNSM